MFITYDDNQSNSISQSTAISAGFLEEFDRKSAFKIWQLTSGGKKLCELCKILGITSPALSMLLKNDTMPVQHHTALIAAGVPASVLPSPLDKTMGRKPKPLPATSS